MRVDARTSLTVHTVHNCYLTGLTNLQNYLLIIDCLQVIQLDFLVNFHHATTMIAMTTRGHEQQQVLTTTMGLNNVSTDRYKDQKRQDLNNARTWHSSGIWTQHRDLKQHQDLHSVRTCTTLGLNYVYQSLSKDQGRDFSNIWTILEPGHWTSWPVIHKD